MNVEEKKGITEIKRELLIYGEKRITDCFLYK